MFTSSRKQTRPEHDVCDGDDDNDGVVVTDSVTIEQSPSAYYNRTGAAPPIPEDFPVGGSGAATFGSTTRGETTTVASTAASDLRNPSCWTRFTKELNLCQPWFYVADPTTGRKIDVAESFAPGTGFALLSKLFITGFIISTLVVTWVQTTDAAFYLAYLTNWATLLSTLYSCLSLWNSVWSSRTAQPPDRATCRIRTTWALFSMAAHSEIVATVLYWALIFEPGVTDITYTTIAPHAAVMVLVLLDGLVINCIPLRWMHYFGFVLTLDCLYILWTILQSGLVFQVGNPNRSDGDPETDDDAIYAALDWDDNTVYCTILVILMCLVVGPIIYALMWLASLYRCGCCSKKTTSTSCCSCTDRRRYIDSFRDEEEENPRARVSDVEEGSIFARWF